MVKGSSRMDKQDTGDARNSKGTVTMSALQHFMKQEAELKELKKQMEAAKIRGEELKALEKYIDPNLVRIRTGDFEGIGSDELEKIHDMLVEIKSMIHDRFN